MHKTVTVSACAVFALISLSILTGSAMADTLLWTNGGGDGLWDTTHDGYSDNWSPNYTPEIFFNDKAQINLIPGPLIDADTNAECQWLALSDGGAGELTMTGGTLDVNTYEPTGDSWFIIGYGLSDVGIFTLDDGVVTTDNRVFVGFKGTGILNMTGGTFKIGGMFGIGYNDANSTAGRGYVYLDGGTITAADFQMGYPTGCIGILDIAGGTLIINGDKTSLINDYIAASRIIALGGWGIVDVDYGITNSGKTTVTGLVDPQKAANPSPANNAENVMPDATLSWTAGVGAASHDVYFGTINPPPFIGNQTATTFTPDTVLVPNTTYYWRINEINGSNTIIGYVWKFTTVSDMATNPDPTNSAAGVVLDKVLSWTPGYGAVSHNVYFGTDESSVRLTGDLDLNGQVDYNDLFILSDYWLLDPADSEPYAGVNDDNIVDFKDYALLAQNWKNSATLVFKGNQDTNNFNPGTLTLNTIYYWRIDEVNGPNMVKGDVWSFTTSNSNYSLYGKIMCGYQGWFNTPTDGAGRGWVHWGNGSFSPTSCNVDLWPDMTEYGPDEKFLASTFYDGNDHYVFSPYKRDTVLRHFQWMQQYGIDGVYLQRFATEVIPGSAAFNHRNAVLSHCRDGANMYGRKYAVMYDLSGLGLGGTSKVINDWKYLVDTMHIGKDPCDNGYMFHKGKPVVSVWGIGFNDGRQYTLSECLALVNFLKNDPVYGGCTVMVGVPTYWRTLDNTKDCLNDPMVHTVILAADIVSPWLVGRYGDTTGVNNWASVGASDKIWCDANDKDYLPVMFPGFSWHNMHNGSKPLNQIPRNGGQFLWDQVRANISIVGANMIYVAMFDEVDEGTAIFKITNNPPKPGGVDMFVTPSYDGISLPSDEYLWLVGQATRGLRGEIPVNATRPARP